MKSEKLEEEFLQEDFWCEIPPLETFEVMAHIVFCDSPLPDISDLEEF